MDAVGKARLQSFYKGINAGDVLIQDQGSLNVKQETNDKFLGAYQEKSFEEFVHAYKMDPVHKSFGKEVIRLANILPDASYKNEPHELYKLGLQPQSTQHSFVSEISMGSKQLDSVLGLYSDKSFGDLHIKDLDSVSKSFGMEADILLANIVGETADINEQINNFLGLACKVGQQPFGAQILPDAEYKNEPHKLYNLFPRLASKLGLQPQSIQHNCVPESSTGSKRLDGVLGLYSQKSFGDVRIENLDCIAKSFGMEADILLATIIAETAGLNEQSNIFLGMAKKVAQQPFGAQALQSFLSSDIWTVNGYSHASGTIRNTVTMYLDGNPEQILRNYLEVMAHLRLWFVSRGIDIDLSPILGYHRIVHVVPDDGTFFLVVKHKEKAAALIIDAREAWLHGSAGSRAICRFGRGECEPYITHEYSITLRDGGEYRAVAAKGEGEVPLGIPPLIQAVSVIDRFDGEESEQESAMMMMVAWVESSASMMLMELWCRCF